MENLSLWPEQGKVRICNVTWCKREALPEHTMCSRCVEARRLGAQRMREKRRKAGYCFGCGRVPVTNNEYCEACRAYQRNHHWQHRDDYRLRAQTNQLRRKLEALAAYGGKCACCGESDFRFLTIDHINNDGAEHKRAEGRNFSMFRWVYHHGFPSGFQILCFNCNCGKGIYGECPHKLAPDALPRKRPTIKHARERGGPANEPSHHDIHEATAS